MNELTRWLRDQPSLIGTPPPLDLSDLPADPHDLFDRWIRASADAGIPEVRAATLATADAAGRPDARTLILKGVSADGWEFAGPRSSAKGRQLAENPAAALTFWWQPVMRAVRVRGTVHEAAPAESAADIAGSPAGALLGPGEWALWRLVPERIEFWQGSPDRRHVRIVFTRDGDDWTREV
ncbi:pyridoxine/pyridoxamine 5'-phosphate oxidase [Microbacterium sp. 11MF]|uniref:pyridoxine/pyridoxamine 5'-phosphate oxidase n=1 Tax=Microbacterium sp. 11MF TaxID=1169146 RepID=UPI000366232B|nr:pyridoxamine 5'-phosphate oxidase family protein [Microbacterium sp. 11MF]